MKRTLSPLYLILVFSLIASYTYAQRGERMIARVYYQATSDTSGFIPQDSAIYLYSTPGPRLDSTWGVINSFDANDSLVDYIYNGSAYIIYLIQKRIFGQDNLPHSDTTLLWDSQANYIFYKYSETTAYDLPNHSSQTLTLTYDTGTHTWSNYIEDAVSFSNNNSLLSGSQLMWQTNTWDTSIFRQYTYNANNQPLSYTHYVEFNISNSFRDRYLYSYDSLGRLDTTLYQTLNHGSAIWQNSSLSINTYDSLSDLSLQINYSWDGAGWDTASRILYTYDTRHNNIQNITESFDTGAWTNSAKYIYTYDSLNNVTTSTQLTWDTSGTWLPRFGNQVIHYYYAPYAQPTGIATITPGGDLRVYPVPASDMLSVDIQWQQAQDASLAIYDMSGRRYSTWQTGRTAAYHGYIPVSGLPAGMYTMQITGASGSMSRTFNIMR